MARAVTSSAGPSNRVTLPLNGASVNGASDVFDEGLVTGSDWAQLLRSPADLPPMWTWTPIDAHAGIAKHPSGLCLCTFVDEDLDELVAAWSFRGVRLGWAVMGEA